MFNGFVHLHSPDILIGSESKLSPDIVDSEVFPNGYIAIRKDRNQHGGGVFVMLREGISFKRLPATDDELELTGVSIDSGDGSSVIVLSYYRPHHNDLRSLQLLSEAIQRIYDPDGPNSLILCGDFNTPDFLTDCLTPPTEFLEEFTYNTGLEQLVDFPTRGTNALDLLYTSDPDRIYDIQPVSGISDHDGVLFYSDLNVPIVSPRQIPPTFDYNKADWEEVRSYVSCNLGLYDKSKTVERNWQVFKYTLHSAAQAYIPLRSGPTNPGAHEAFFQPHIRAIHKQKDRAFKRARSTGLQTDVAELRRLKKLLKKKIRRFHKNRDTMISNDLTNNRKKFFRYVKMKTDRKFGVPNLVDGDLTITEDQSKASTLNDFFQSVQTDEPPISHADLIFGPHLEPIPFLRIDTNGVRVLLEKLNTKKAGGCDNLPPVLLKETAEQICSFLSTLFTESLACGDIPTDWKLSRIHPIHKKGSRSDKSNYRPISLTCIACKVMEHVIYSHVAGHLSKLNILDERQHGFRENHSCETQLLSVLEYWTDALDHSDKVLAVLLDFSKAFDTVPHLRLVQKLEHYGINGRVLHWIVSFLRRRVQIVSVNGCDSEELPVKSGVPQGSVLGPLLFLIYINDISCGLASPIHLFADDSILFRRLSDQKDIDTLQNDLRLLQDWSDRWLLRFNASKSQQITIRSGYHQYRNPDLYLNGELLQCYDNVKYLGVTINKHLAWKPHVHNVATNAKQRLGFLRRHFSGFCRSAKQLLFNTYALPMVEFSCAAWDPYTQADIEHLESINSRGVRFITGRYSSYESVTALRASLGMQHLSGRRKSVRLDRLKHFVTGKLPIQYAKPVTLQNERPGIQTRQADVSQRYVVPNARLNCRYYSFFPRTIRDWNNDLPGDQN